MNICHLNDDMILFFLQATFIESSQLADIVPSEIVSNTNTFNNEFGVDLGDNEVLILTLSGTPQTSINLKSKSYQNVDHSNAPFSGIESVLNSLEIFARVGCLLGRFNNFTSWEEIFAKLGNHSQNIE